MTGPLRCAIAGCAEILTIDTPICGIPIEDGPPGRNALVCWEHGARDTYTLDELRAEARP